MPDRLGNCSAARLLKARNGVQHCQKAGAFSSSSSLSQAGHWSLSYMSFAPDFSGKPPKGAFWAVAVPMKG